MRRLGIFSFGDREGIIDKYVIFMLGNMKEQMDKIICVVQHRVDPKWRPILDRLCDVILEPGNCEDYRTAYAAGLNYALVYRNNYDQMILFNDSLIGPLTPLGDLFASIDSSEADIVAYTDPEAHHGLEFLCLKKSAYSDDSFEAWAKETVDDQGISNERIKALIGLKSYKTDSILRDEDDSGSDILVDRADRIVKESMGPFITMKSFADPPEEPYSVKPSAVYDALAAVQNYEERFISEYIYRVNGEDYVTEMLGHIYVLDNLETGHAVAAPLYMIWAENADNIGILRGFPNQRQSMMMICSDDDLAAEIRERYPEIQVFTSSKTPAEALTGSLLNAVILRYGTVCFARLPDKNDGEGRYLTEMILKYGKQLSAAVSEKQLLVPYTGRYTYETEETGRKIFFVAQTGWLKKLKTVSGESIMKALMLKAKAENMPVSRFTDSRVMENVLNRPESKRSDRLPDNASQDDRYKAFLEHLLTTDDRREIAHLKHAMFSKKRREELYKELFG
ncbi:MAG: hypothetical protein IKE27_02665 [Oscillospiraceae bacterium]|nr:hypothetical protein [Oscillospiraceae bacterium]